MEPIAIIGMACRFPGAPTLDAFWSLLSEGREGIVEVPADRWNVGTYFDADPKAAGKTNARTGGFIEDIARFDAAFFGIAPREAAQIDPQQRILLELAYDALEDAGREIRPTRPLRRIGERERHLGFFGGAQTRQKRIGGADDLDALGIGGGRLSQCSSGRLGASRGIQCGGRDG